MNQQAVRDATMKKIEGFIRPSKLKEVKDALVEVGIYGMTVTEASDFGRHTGLAERNHSTAYLVEFPKLKIEIVLAAGQVGAAVEAIVKSARTGSVGDGKIFVSKVEKAIRTRTGECGEAAILGDATPATLRP